MDSLQHQEKACILTLPSPSARNLVRSQQSKTVLALAASVGTSRLQKILRAKVTQYEHRHGEDILPHAVAQDLANTLYGRRFFPYDMECPCGLDQQGVIVVYSMIRWATTSACACR